MNGKSQFKTHDTESSSFSLLHGSARRSRHSERSVHSSPRRNGDFSSSPSPHRRQRPKNGHSGHDPFHYNDTLPPNAVGRSVPPEMLSEDDEYHTPYAAPLDADYSNANSKHKLELRVRIEGVKDLVPDSRAMQTPPSTFVTVQTAYGRGKTPVIYNNSNPPFNDEFMFQVNNPETEEITVTVVAVTSTGGKKIGQCALSVGNLMQRMERRQWVALVRHPGTERAYECGEILISLYSENSGTDVYSSPLKEKEFREKLRALFRKDAPQELHRLEWYVGKCVEDYDGAYAAIFGRYHKPHCESAAFQLTINSVADLTMKNGSPTTRETCYVKVTSSRLKKVTKMVPYHRRAVFNEKFDMVIDNPKADSISLAVYSANHKYGECLVSLNGLQPRVPKERTHNIVYAAGTGDACYCGTIKIVLCTVNYGTESPVSDAEDEKRRIRLRNYLWNYLRDDLHRLDPIVASISHMDSFMGKLVRAYGPEPRPYTMTLRIQNFHRNEKEEKPKTYAVVVRMGPEIYRTAGVRFSQDFIFSNETTFPVYTAEKGELFFMVVDEADVNDAEVGRVVISLRGIVRESLFQLQLPVYQEALTADAKVVGTLSIEGIVHGYGLLKEVISPKKKKYFCQRVEALLSHYDPSQLHRVEYLLGEYVGQEERLIKELTDTLGPETGSAPMRVCIVNINDFAPMCSCFVKVYLDDVLVLRTKDHHAAKSLVFDIEMKNETTVSIANPLHSTLRFKVCEHRLFRASRLLGVAEMSLRNMVRDELNLCSLSLFDEGTREEIGVLAVEVQSPGFVKGTVTMYGKPRNGGKGSAVEEVTRDVTSLMRKYLPQEVPHAQPLISKATSLRNAHRELLKRFAPDPIDFTFYVHIDNVNMFRTEDKDAVEKGNISISASFLNEEMRSYLKVKWEDRIDTYKYFPEMRMDISFLRGSVSTRRVPPLEIVFYEKSAPAAQASSVVSKRNTIYKSLLLPERELGRILLSLRALLTRRVYRLGEAFTVPILRSASRSVMPGGLGGTVPGVIMGEITLHVTTPAFEHIPHQLRFAPKKMEHYNRGYVRHFEKRISAFYRLYDPSSLRELHFTLYERHVASARWPRSLYDWLLMLIKQHGPEPINEFGPPPKLSFDDDSEEENEEDEDEEEEEEEEKRSQENGRHATGTITRREEMVNSLPSSRLQSRRHRLIRPNTN
ncbi:hypothetical protein TCSYLVIO_004748 [Trypanosoma cruzi]|nr:hypothetical protein TCSYLVIO_004748 [Trypanosoma cruzi]